MIPHWVQFTCENLCFLVYHYLTTAIPYSLHMHSHLPAFLSIDWLLFSFCPLQRWVKNKVREIEKQKYHSEWRWFPKNWLEPATCLIYSYTHRPFCAFRVIWSECAPTCVEWYIRNNVNRDMAIKKRIAIFFFMYWVVQLPPSTEHHSLGATGKKIAHALYSFAAIFSPSVTRHLVLVGWVVISSGIAKLALTAIRKWLFGHTIFWEKLLWHTWEL